jgi:hypothetical protein
MFICYSAAWNGFIPRKFHYHVHNSQPRVPILNRLNSVQTYPMYLRSTLMLSSKFSLLSPSFLFPSGSPTKPHPHYIYNLSFVIFFYILRFSNVIVNTSRYCSLRLSNDNVNTSRYCSLRLSNDTVNTSRYCSWSAGWPVEEKKLDRFGRKRLWRHFN